MTQRKILAAGVVILVLGLAYGGYKFMSGSGEGGQQGGPMGMPVEAAKVVSDTMHINITAVGSLVAHEGIVLRPEIAGRVTEILFTEGQKVEKGAPLFTLDDSIYRAQLSQAQAQQALAERNSSRATSLLGRGAGTEQSRDQANADLRIANAAVELAKANLDKTHIVAPFSGTIGIRKVSIGDYVSPGQDLISLQALDPMKVDFGVPETALASLTPGQKLQLTVSPYPGLTFEGTVEAIDPQVDPATRTVLIRASVPNAESKLTPGLFANITLTTADKPGTLFVPSASIWPVGSQSFVFKITDGVANMIPVTVIQREADRVAVTGDMKADDQVVTAGQTKLTMGPPGPVPVMVIDPNAQQQSAPPAEQPKPEEQH